MVVVLPNRLVPDIDGVLGLDIRQAVVVDDLEDDGVGEAVHRLGHLPIRAQGIQGEVDLYIPQMAIRNRRRKLLL